MSYVVYTQTHVQQVKYQWRHTPLRTAFKWLGERTSVSFFEVVLSFFIRGSLLAELSISVASSVLVATALEILFEGSHEWQYIVPITIAVGTTAGLAAQGAAGAVIGCTLGWLVAAMASGASEKYIPDSLERHFGLIASWVLAGILGWAVGLGAAWLFDKLCCTYPKSKRTLEKVAITLATLVACYLAFLVVYTLLDLPERAPFSTRIVIYVVGVIVIPAVWATIVAHFDLLGLLLGWFALLASLVARIVHVGNEHASALAMHYSQRRYGYGYRAVDPLYDFLFTPPPPPFWSRRFLPVIVVTSTAAALTSANYLSDLLDVPTVVPLIAIGYCGFVLYVAIKVLRA